MFLNTGLARGSILVDHGHFDALFFLQLQRAQPVGTNIHDVHTQIGTCSRILAGNTEGL